MLAIYHGIHMLQITLTMWWDICTKANFVVEKRGCDIYLDMMCDETSCVLITI